MPKFGGHIVIGEAVARRLGYTEAQIHKRPEGAALRLGAVGPDLTLFLLDPAEDNSFVFGALGTGMRLYGEIRKIRDRLKEITDYFGSPTLSVADWMTGGLSTSALESVGLAVQSFVSALKLVAFSKHTITVVNPFEGLDTNTLRRIFGADYLSWAAIPTIDLSPNLDSSQITSPAWIFRHFGHPYSDDPPFKTPALAGDYSQWWWMDILHYRRTAQFARNLLNLAQSSGDPVLIAYAHGYFSHVGGDIVGHPYINSMVGGPFRNHALRHMVIESLLDVRIWQESRSTEIHSARLDKLMELDRPRVERIAQMVSQALGATYLDPSAGPPIATRHFGGREPSPKDIELAYDTMTGYLSFSTDVGLEPPQRPPESLGALWDEIREHLAATLGKINDYWHDLGSASGWDWFAALIGLVMWTAALVVQMLTLPPALLMRIVAIAPRWIAYLINSAMYDFVRSVRYAMALCGWGYAGTEDLTRSMSKSLLTVRPWAEGGGERPLYPFAMAPRVDGFWLEYPRDLGTAVEEEWTISGPYTTAHGPAAFIDGLPYDSAHDAELQALATPPPGSNEVGTRKALQSILRADPASAFLGNAADFTVQLIHGQFPDGAFDLDGDRGYASAQWEGYPLGSDYRPPSSRYI